MTAPSENTDTGAEAGAETENTTGASDAAEQDSDTGYPPDTPLAEMTTEQQLAYYKTQNRRAEKRLAALKGVTPQQVKQMQTRISELETSALTADEKALKEAVDAAAAEASAAAQRQWGPKYQMAVLRGIASEVLKGDQLKGWLDGVDPGRFATDDGEIDEDKVMANLTAIFGRADSAPPVRQWGQHANAGAAGVEPGSAGRAEAKRRYGLT